MATFSTEELARKLLSLYSPGSPGQEGQVLTREQMLRKWPKGFTHVELGSGVEYACLRGWLTHTDQGYQLSAAGRAESSSQH